MNTMVTTAGDADKIVVEANVFAHCENASQLHTAAPLGADISNGTSNETQTLAVHTQVL